MKLVIKGGRIISPGDGIDLVGDIQIENGVIKRLSDSQTDTEGADVLKLGESIDESTLNKEFIVIDATGLIVAPGFVDIHVHFREPGYEDAETIETGMMAAAAGGFTSVVTMPNTNPAIDNQSQALFVLSEAKKHGYVHVFPAGAITLGRKGKALASIGEMAEAGIVAITDDGDCVMDGMVMRRALEYSSSFGVKVISHSEDKTLAAGGAMNEGIVSTTLGLPPIPPQAETIMVFRDIALCELTGVPVHIAHVSTAKSLDLVRQAKAAGLNVTAEVAPHHLTLTDEAVAEYDTNTKVNPPLRTQADIDALIEGLIDGTLDAIATDHAPHTSTDKSRDYISAPFGIVGLESAVPVCLDRLHHKKGLPIEILIEKLTVGPARAIGMQKGTLREGEIADITILDLQKEVTIDPSNFHSKGKNCPFAGWSLTGAPVVTITAGKIKMMDGKLVC
ncbi:dihydroorotase [bacterium]|nr:dihydroorotase [bacterium]